MKRGLLRISLCVAAVASLNWAVFAGQGAYSFRFDDNKPTNVWHAIAAICEAEGVRCTFAVNAGLLKPDQAACLRALAARGFEIADHTPKHFVETNAVAVRAAAQASRELFAKHGLPRPRVWLQPGGRFPCVDWRVIKQVYGDEFGYVCADALVGRKHDLSGCDAATKMRFTLPHGGAFLDRSARTVEELTKEIVEATKDGRPYHIYSHSLPMKGENGREMWRTELRRLIRALKAAGVPVLPIGSGAERAFPSPQGP